MHEPKAGHDPTSNLTSSMAKSPSIPSPRSALIKTIIKKTAYNKVIVKNFKQNTFKYESEIFIVGYLGYGNALCTIPNIANIFAEFPQETESVFRAQI